MSEGATVELSGRLPCPAGCARLSRSHKPGHTLPLHLLGCHDCGRIWHVVELTAPRRPS